MEQTERHRLTLLGVSSWAGRGSFVATSGSACAPPLDVEAIALSAMWFVVTRADCGGFVVFAVARSPGCCESSLGERWKWRVVLLS
jgi:hypothetical protein